MGEYVSKFCTYFNLKFIRVGIVKQIIDRKIYRIGQVYFQNVKLASVEQFIEGSYFDLYPVVYNKNQPPHYLIFQILPPDGLYKLPIDFSTVHLSAIPVHFGENDIYDMLNHFCEFYTDKELEEGGYKGIIFGENFNSYFSYFTGQAKIKVKSFRMKLPKKLQSKCGSFLVSVDMVKGYDEAEIGINFV